VATEDLNLVGLAMHGDRKMVDKVVKGLKLHDYLLLWWRLLVQVEELSVLLQPADVFRHALSRSLHGDVGGTCDMGGCHHIVVEDRIIGVRGLLPEYIQAHPLKT